MIVALGSDQGGYGFQSTHCYPENLYSSIEHIVKRRALERTLKFDVLNIWCAI